MAETTGGLSRTVYDHAPVFLQNLLCSLTGYRKKRQRYGGTWGAWKDFFEQARHWSRSKLEAYQDEQLRQVLRAAFAHVPFYRQRYGALGLQPDDIRSRADLPKLPLLEKDDLRRAGRDILADNVDPKSLQHATTGGSTGAALTNYWPSEAVERMYGFLWGRWRANFRYGSPYASFASPPIVPAGQSRPPYWRENRAARQTLYSVYHLSPSTADAYLDDLSGRPFAYYEGYPTPMYLLGRWLLERPRTFRTWPKAVFTTSEELQPHHREVIERAFHTRVYNQYGQNEQVACISEYDCGHLHQDMDFSIVEFLPVDTTPDGKDICEMVCTGFANLAAPLVRYRVGDLAVLADPQPDCPVHAGPVVERILGRTGHVLIGRSGRIFHNITAIARQAEGIELIQCVQDEPGQMEVRVVPAGTWTDADEDRLRELIYQRMGEELEFAVKVADTVERSRSGKFLSIVSHVDPAAREEALRRS